MKRFEFRLKTLLRIREAARDDCRAQVADALRVEAELQQQMATIDGEIAAARRAHTADVGLVDVDRLLAGQRYGLVLEQDRRRLVEQQAIVAAELERRRAALVEADREVRVLERLRDTQRQRWQNAVERAEMKVLDELAGQRYLQQEV